jgi:hypothetical protein
VDDELVRRAIPEEDAMLEDGAEMIEIEVRPILADEGFIFEAVASRIELVNVVDVDDALGVVELSDGSDLVLEGHLVVRGGQRADKGGGYAVAFPLAVMPVDGGIARPVSVQEEEARLVVNGLEKGWKELL